MKYPKKFQIMLILSCIIGLTYMTAGLTYNGASTTALKASMTQEEFGGLRPMMMNHGI